MIGAPLSEIGVSDLEGLWADFAESISDTAVIDPRTDISIGGEQAFQAIFLDTEIQAQGQLITAISGETGYVLIVMVQPPVHFETFQPVFQMMLDSVDLFAPTATSRAEPSE